MYETAEVVHNYSAAGIPLETMWNDIDYMDRRRVFTNDPARYPVSKVRELVDYLHDHNQHYIVMVDPAVSVSSKSFFSIGLDMAKNQITLRTRTESTRMYSSRRKTDLSTRVCYTSPSTSYTRHIYSLTYRRCLAGSHCIPRLVPS